MRTLVYWNPLAGSGRIFKVKELVCRILRAQKNAFEVTERVADAALFACHGPWRAIVIGGDGTFNYFINRVPIENLTLLPVSAGSGNDLARMLHGTLDPAKQLTTALAAKPRPMDIWSVNGTRFLETCGIGFDGLVAHRSRIIGKYLGGSLRYQATVARYLFTTPPFEALIRIDNEAPVQRRLFMFSLGNGRYAGGGYTLWPDARIDDGQLNIMMISDLSAWQKIRYVSLVRHGKHVGLPVVETKTARTIHLETDRELMMHVDGELSASNNFSIKHASHINYQA
jgi:diacylglycerol kinase (ATP)